MNGSVFASLRSYAGHLQLGAFLLFALPQNPLARVVGWVLPIGALLYTVVSIGVELFGKRSERKQTRYYSSEERSVWKSKIILVILLPALFFAVFLYWLLFQQYGGALLFTGFVLELAFALILLGVVLVIFFRGRKPGK
ncbi:MAG: hypothetical protein QMD08_00190 [Actinomycetota bacterium]|nr:hypothetical protein [Actinomycetota bacterium]